jgi:hypothetical protein
MRYAAYIPPCSALDDKVESQLNVTCVSLALTQAKEPGSVSSWRKRLFGTVGSALGPKAVSWAALPP